MTSRTSPDNRSSCCAGKIIRGNLRNDRGAVPNADAGQATVEFALLLPLFLILAMGLVQVAVVVRSQLVVEQAAQAAARAAAVNPRPEIAREAANRDDRFAQMNGEVSMHLAGSDPALVVVTVKAPIQVQLPFVRTAASRLEVSATAVMAVEGPG